MPTLEAQRKRTYTALFIAAVAIVLSLSAAGFALIQRFDATATARANNQRVWHAVICEIEHAVYRSPSMSAHQRSHAIKFYNGLLVNDVGATPCSVAEIHGQSKAIPRR